MADQAVHDQLETGVEFLEYYKDWMGRAPVFKIKDEDEKWGKPYLRLDSGDVFADITPSEEHGWVATLFIDRGGHGTGVAPYADDVADHPSATIVGAIGWVLKQFYDFSIHSIMKDFQMREDWY